MKTIEQQIEEVKLKLKFADQEYKLCEEEFMMAKHECETLDAILFALEQKLEGK